MPKSTRRQRAAVARLHQGQRADRAEQGLVGQAGAGERLVEREGAAVVALGFEDAADAGQGQFGDAALGAERVEDELHGLEQVAVPAAAVAAGELAQPGGGEVGGVPVAGLAQPGPGVGLGVSGIWLQQGAAVLGDEPEQHPVHQPQQRPVEVVQLQVGVARVEPAAQLRVVRMGQEPGAEDGDGLLDAVAELIERPLALLDGEAAPLFQVAGLGAAVGLDREPGLVAGQVEQHEVGEQFPVEDRLQVELDVGGADQRGRVAQQPQRGAVGQDRPQVGVVAVEQFLEHGLRGAGGDVRGLVVQVGGPAEQVDGHVPGPVADREALALQLEAAPGHLVEAELAQQDAQPPFPGDPRRCGLGRIGPAPSTRRLKSCQTSSRYSQDREACRRTDSPRSSP